ncbi:MAG TPA: HEAT repeat domain-containing protein, partial [Planctomycetota bacterium]
VTRALDGLEIGPPLGYKNLTLYPLLAASEKSVAVTTLPQALGDNRVDITEENSLLVRVKNKGDAALVLLAGEILVGGRTDRVVARDTIVPAGKDRAVEVFDVEPAGQARAAEKIAFRPESGHYWASLGMRRLLNEEPGQAGVWAAILGPGGRIPPVDLYRDHRTGLLEYHMALVDLKSAYPMMVGVAVAVGDSLVSAEIFGSPALLTSHFDRILGSASLEALLAGPGRETRGLSEFSSSAAAVKRMLETAFSAEQDVENDLIVVRRHGRPVGRAVTVGGEAVRVLLFPDSSSAPRPSLDLAVQPAKVKRAVDAYEARLDSATGPRRVSILREMAMLPGDYPRQKVLDHAKSDKVRTPAIEALGLRGDPAAVEPLLEWLKETRKDPAVAIYAALAQALARLGSEKAISVLIQDLDPKTPLIARAAAEHLPSLMIGLRNLNTLETTMGGLIQALERFSAEPSDPQGFSWPVRTLRLITGKEYGRTSDFSTWWNTPLERATFLEQRRRP